MKCLIITDESFYLNAGVIELLHRASFRVDILSSNRLHANYPSVCNFILAESTTSIPHQASHIENQYKLIVVCGDQTLYLIKNSNLQLAEKVKILPITDSKYINHLCSKIELSNTLTANNILTPEYRSCENLEDLPQIISDLGYPLILKIDFSGGGHGCFELNNDKDIKKIPAEFKNQRLLVQKLIEGKLIDASAFYQDKKLVHFSYSESLKTSGHKFGVSLLRRYHQIGSLDKGLFEDLDLLGKALGANGFVNIGLIETKDRKRYFFEADMRPNVWVNYPMHIGDDPGMRINEYINFGTYCTYPHQLNSAFPLTKVLPFTPRVKFWELLLNRYNCLAYINPRLTLLEYRSINIKLCLKILAVRFIKPIIPIGLWVMLKKI